MLWLPSTPELWHDFFTVIRRYGFPYKLFLPRLPPLHFCVARIFPTGSYRMTGVRFDKNSIKIARRSLCNTPKLLVQSFRRALCISESGRSYSPLASSRNFVHAYVSHWKLSTHDRQGRHQTLTDRQAGSSRTTIQEVMYWQRDQLGRAACTHTVKNILIYTDISRRVFRYFNGTGSVYVCVRKSAEKWSPCMPTWARASVGYSLFRLLKCGKLATKYPWIYGCFYSVQDEE